MHHPALSIRVATPTLRGILSVSYVQAMMALQKFCFDRNYGFAHDLLVGVSVIGHARNLMVSNFLSQSDHTHLLFIDDDMGFNAEEVGRMLDWPDADVVAVMCPKKRFNWAGIKAAVLADPGIDPAVLPNLTGDYAGMFVLSGDTQTMAIGDAPIPVDAIGTGIMMISRVCLQRLIETAGLEPSYHALASGPVYDFFRTDHDRDGIVGEDFAFCNLVRRHGGTILGCPWPVVIHSGQIDFLGDLRGIARYLP